MKSFPIIYEVQDKKHLTVPYDFYAAKQQECKKSHWEIKKLSGDIN